MEPGISFEFAITITAPTFIPELTFDYIIILLCDYLELVFNRFLIGF